MIAEQQTQEALGKSVEELQLKLKESQDKAAAQAKVIAEQQTQEAQQSKIAALLKAQVEKMNAAHLCRALQKG